MQRCYLRCKCSAKKHHRYKEGVPGATVQTPQYSFALFLWGSGGFWALRLSLCQRFSVASFPREGRVSCTLVICNCTRAWWEPWPARVSQKRLGRLGSVLAPAPRMSSRGELGNTAPRKRQDAFSHILLFPSNYNHSLLGRVSYCWKRACAGGQTLLSFKVHLTFWKRQ